mgnify:CR=1 FL=1
MNFEELIKQIKDAAPVATSPNAAGGQAKYRSMIPLTDQMIAGKTQLRAQQYFSRNLAPLKAQLDAMTKLDLDVLFYLETGAPEARAVEQQHEANKSELRKAMSPYWDELRLLRKQYLKEGMTADEHRRAFGALCGRYELMRGTVKTNGRLDLDTVTTQHIMAALKDIQAEIDAQAHKGGEGGDTCAEYVVEDAETPTIIGDCTEADTDELLASEYAAIDALAAKVKAQSA